MEEIVNKVAASGLVTINLEEFYPAGDRVSIDLADQLWQGLALREKDFRSWIQTHDWSQYQGKHVAVFCSVDAIIPAWAFMLVASALSDYAVTVVQGNRNELEEVLFRNIVDGLDLTVYQDKRCVVKGCSNLPVPQSAYTHLVVKLRPVVRSIMFGEPCSTVPVFKRS
jgi:S-adenosylmethionine/arginine decarboxylase-like enzyme